MVPCTVRRAWGKKRSYLLALLRRPLGLLGKAVEGRSAELDVRDLALGFLVRVGLGSAVSSSRLAADHGELDVAQSEVVLKKRQRSVWSVFSGGERGGEKGNGPRGWRSRGIVCPCSRG